MNHKCHAYGCPTSCPPSQLMCKSHWRQVPKAMQEAVWRTYNPGQERNKKPSPAWLLAAFTAIDYIAVKEGRMTQTQADAHIQTFKDKARAAV